MSKNRPASLDHDRAIRAELLAACKYVADLTGCALSKEQARTLQKRCQAAIRLATGQP